MRTSRYSRAVRRRSSTSSSCRSRVRTAAHRDVVFGAVLRRGLEAPAGPSPCSIRRRARRSSASHGLFEPVRHCSAMGYAGLDLLGIEAALEEVAAAETHGTGEFRDAGRRCGEHDRGDRLQPSDVRGKLVVEVGGRNHDHLAGSPGDHCEDPACRSPLGSPRKPRLRRAASVIVSGEGTDRDSRNAGRVGRTLRMSVALGSKSIVLSSNPRVNRDRDSWAGISSSTGTARMPTRHPTSTADSSPRRRRDGYTIRRGTAGSRPGRRSADAGRGTHFRGPEWSAPGFGQGVLHLEGPSTIHAIA